MQKRRNALRPFGTAIASLSLALSASLAHAAPEPPQPPQEKPQLSVGSTDGSGVVTCQLIAQKPNYSGGVVTGVGGINNCVPRRPDACTTVPELWIWMPGPGQWAPASEGPTIRTCPPPYRSGRASIDCNYNSDYPTHGYKIITTGSIVYGGSRDSGSAHGDVLYLKCV